ncbi:MAG: C25 family cysteine peptidase [Solirubrobacteraceae bacterium]
MLPVFFSINCSSGRFDSPGSPSFSENLLRRAGGGAVGVIGASRTASRSASSTRSTRARSRRAAPARRCGAWARC